MRRGLDVVITRGSPLRRPTACTRSVTARHFHQNWIRRKDHKPHRDSHNSFRKDDKEPLVQRLVAAWRDTPTKWYPLPIAVGALLLATIQFRNTTAGSGNSTEVQTDEEGRQIARLKGPWQVHVLGALPLRNLSRLWGYLNSLELPMWFRPFGFRLYSLIFGCNLDEIERDLTTYTSLGDFFYRRLKPGSRLSRSPCPNPKQVSPADGKILHFGVIEGTEVEQVKGITYSLDALLGVLDPSQPANAPTLKVTFANRDQAIVEDREFANVNGIEYSLGQLLGSGDQQKDDRSKSLSSPSAKTENPQQHGEQVDASIAQPRSQDTLSRHATVASELGLRPTLQRSTSGTSVRDGHALFFTVVYLAPGDYHRFHSPTAWVVEKRRHFVGELFSVSPYMAKRLQDLFVLNERVALLGRWKYGFFGMVPVGATNVGSIIINFDEHLRTNLRGPKPPPGTFAEAVYQDASPILHGQPLTAGQEMGGFKLGSTVVLVFEAPKTFQFQLHAGQKVKVGEVLGDLVLKS